MKVHLYVIRKQARVVTQKSSFEYWSVSYNYVEYLVWYICTQNAIAIIVLMRMTDWNLQ